MSGIGYFQLLKENKPFRRLFTADMISYIGDWFTVIALFILAGESSDNSPLAIAGVLATRSFSLAAMTPFTGMLACLLYTSPSPRDKRQSRMPSSA